MKIVKFLVNMWLVIAIITFLVALYWAAKGVTYDAMYFLGFSLVATILFLMRRKQNRMYNKNTKE